MKIVSAASVGLEPGLRGLIVQRATANLFHQLVFRERIFGSYVYIEIYGVLLRQTFARNSCAIVCDRMLRNNVGS